MRAEIKRKFPDFARYLQPKCGEFRLGYCDESFADWEGCPIGRNALSDLNDRDYAVIESEPDEETDKTRGEAF
jgi:hypothetical protein